MIIIVARGSVSTRFKLSPLCTSVLEMSARSVGLHFIKLNISLNDSHLFFFIFFLFFFSCCSLLSIRSLLLFLLYYKQEKTHFAVWHTIVSFKVSNHYEPAQLHSYSSFNHEQTNKEKKLLEGKRQRFGSTTLNPFSVEKIITPRHR